MGSLRSVGERFNLFVNLIMTLQSLDDLSLAAQGVLFSIVASVVGIVLLVIFSFLRTVKRTLSKSRKPQRAARGRVADSAASAPVAQPAVQQRQAAVSYKQLVQKSKAPKNRKQSEGKILEHPFYIFSLKDHREGVNGFGWARDGSAVATACEDRCVRLFTFSDTIDKGIVTRQINLQSTPVDVGFLHDAQSLVILSKGFMDTASLLFYASAPSEMGGTRWTCSKTIEKVFDTDQPLGLETVLNSAVSKLLVVACSASKEAKIYDAQGTVLSVFAPNSFLNHDLAVSHNAQLASIATFTADAKIWELKFSRGGDFQSSAKVMDLRGHKSKVMTVAFSMDATRAVSISEDGVLKIWNVDVQYRQQEDPRCLRSIQSVLREGKCYHRLAFGPGNALAAAVHDTIHFVDAEMGGMIGEVEQAHDGPITALAWASVRLPCRKGRVRVLASSSQDRRVRLWSHPEDV